jgi:hypothetical protein
MGSLIINKGERWLGLGNLGVKAVS